MARDIGNKVIVITGASSGIGRATAQAFAQAGCRLVLAARSAPALEIAARECVDAGGQALPFACDVTSADDMMRLAEATQSHYGQLDVWVNDAGVHLFGRLDDVPIDDFRQVIDVNLMGTVHGCRAALPVFRRQGHGTIINIASMSGTVGLPYATADVASKWAVRGMGEALRMELLDQPGIHVCTALPPSIDTRLEEVADMIVSLASRPQRESFMGMTKLMVAAHAIAPGATEGLLARRHRFQNRASRPFQDNGGRSTALWVAAGAAAVAVPLGVYAWRRMRERQGAAYV